MIQALQLIILLPLFSCLMPANTGMFINQLTSIAAYDFLEISEYLDNWLSLVPTNPVNEKYDTIGLGSLYFLNNLGTFTIFLAFTCLTMLLWMVLSPFQNNWLRKKLTQYDTKIFWNHWINVINESFVIVILCIAIHIKYAFEFDSMGEIVHSTTCILSILLYFLLPILVFKTVLKNFRQIQNKKEAIRLSEYSMARYRSFFADLAVKKGKKVLVEPV